MRAVNAKGHMKTFQMMVNEQGWTNIEERSCYGSSKRASLIESGHGEHHLPIATAGKAYLRSTEAGLG